MGELIEVGGGGGFGETRWKISPNFRSPEVGIPEHTQLSYIVALRYSLEHSK